MTHTSSFKGDSPALCSRAEKLPKSGFDSPEVKNNIAFVEVPILSCKSYQTIAALSCHPKENLLRKEVEAFLH